MAFITKNIVDPFRKFHPPKSLGLGLPSYLALRAKFPVLLSTKGFHFPPFRPFGKLHDNLLKMLLDLGSFALEERNNVLQAERDFRTAVEIGRVLPDVEPASLGLSYFKVFMFLSRG